MVNILLGIGNELKGDDGIGNIIAGEFVEDGWFSIQSATVPENFISVIERKNPDNIVLVDASEMDLKPGELRIIPKEKLDSAGTLYKLIV